MIVLAVLFLLLFPSVCCIVLMLQMRDTNGRIAELEIQLAGVEQAVQRMMLQEAGSDARTEEEPEVLVSMGQGDAAGADAMPTQPPLDNIDEPAMKEPAELDTRHKVYLTFDDGPSIYTNDILDLLDEYGVKATFFVVGKEDERSREAIRRIVDEGHTLGMHSYTHKYAEVYASKEDFAADLTKLRDYLYDLTGVESRVYRFPGGSSNTVSPVSMQGLADYLDEQGIVFYDWNISSGDASSKQLSVDTLVRNCTEDLGKWDTTIILMHDSADKPTTVEALPVIIEQILAREDTVILPITEDTAPIQHINRNK